MKKEEKKRKMEMGKEKGNEERKRKRKEGNHSSRSEHGQRSWTTSLNTRQLNSQCQCTFFDGEDNQKIETS